MSVPASDPSMPPTPPPPPLPPVAPPPGQPVPNHLVWAIIATVLGFCLCRPSVIAGIVAIVFSSKVNTLLAQGDIAGAQRASNTAKTWCIVTTVLAAIGLLFNIYWYASGGMAHYQEMIQQMQQMQG